MEKQLFFIHVAKTGGSSIGKCLIPYHYLKNKKWCITHGRPKGSSKHPTYLDLERLLPPSSCREYFAVVRNPLDRLLSAYSYCRFNPRRKFRASHRKSIAYIKNFQSFKHFAMHFDLAEVNPFYFRPQVESLVNEEGVIAVAELLRFERLASDFEAILERFKMRGRERGLLRNDIPWINHSWHGYWEDYYDEESEERVRSLYLEDFLLWEQLNKKT